MLHCDGKCYLMKKMNQLDLEGKQERQKFPFPTQKLEQVETPFISAEFGLDIFSTKVASSKLKISFAYWSNLYHFDFNENCFQPPQKELIV